MTPRPPALRRAQILEQIHRQGGVSITEIVHGHQVSFATAHRDLEELARQGLVQRIHGGARPPGPFLAEQVMPSMIPTAWTQRLHQAEAAKQAIARHAVRYVETGATLFLDASTTALALARELMENPPGELTLVTNSPAIANELQHEAIHAVVAPGELDQHTRALGGRWTVEFLAELHFEIAFVSAAGVTLEQGLTTTRRPLADVVNAAHDRSERTIALIDASKFGRASLLTIVNAQDMDAIVTDPAVSPFVVGEYKAAGVHLQITGADNQEVA